MKCRVCGDGHPRYHTGPGQLARLLEDIATLRESWYAGDERGEREGYLRFVEAFSATLAGAEVAALELLGLCSAACARRVVAQLAGVMLLRGVQP
jgi:hypothetical protein